MAHAIAQGLLHDTEKLFGQLWSNERKDRALDVQLRRGITGSCRRSDELIESLSKIQFPGSTLDQQGNKLANIDHEIVELVNRSTHMQF